MAEDKILKIEEISEKLETKEATEVERQAPNKERFDELIGSGQERRSIEIRSPEGQKSSLMDQVRELNNKVESVSKASPDVLVAQTQEVIKKIEDVKTQLASPDLQLKDSVQNLLKNKLSHIDDSLKVVMNRAGLEYTPQTAGGQTGLIAPIERFIGFLTHGQYQLQKLASDVQMMHLNQEEISPASMLAIQIKVGYIQQEVEFFANMLNKALESTKTIMNVQI
jgi:hypothetical protein